MLGDAAQFSYLPLKSIFSENTKQQSLLNNLNKKFNLNNKIQNGQQKISKDLLSDIFLYCESLNQTGCAFHYGLLSESGSWGLLDYFLASCDTVEVALDELIRYFPLVALTDSLPQLGTDSKQRTIIQLPSSSSKEPRDNVLDELTISTLMALIARLSNHQWPQKINLPQQSFPTSVYEKLSSLGVDIHLNSNNYRITLHPQQQKFQLPFKNDRTISLIKPELEQMLNEVSNSGSIIVEILSLFFAEKNINYLTQSKIASKLNTSESSLKRRLALASSSFTNILSSYKKEKAIAFLNKQFIPISKIANDLGYADRSSFERAFKLWTNLTPSQYMQQLSIAQISLENIKATEINSLPSSPKICQQVLQLTQADDYDIPKLSSVIQTDPVLTAKLMGIANSAYYGGQKVTDINQAIIQVLGVDVVQNMVLSLMCCKQLKIDSGVGFSLENFWFQSLATAESIKQFCQFPNILNNISASELYLAALLHNIGNYTLVFLKPDAMKQFLKGELNYQDFLNYQSEHRFNQQLQEKIFGLNSATVGALVLTHWGLPKSVCGLIRELGDNFDKQSRIARLLSLISIFTQQKIQFEHAEDIPIDFLNQLAEILDTENTVLNKYLVKIVNTFDGLKAISREIA